MTINSVIATIRMDLKHFGIARTFYDVSVRLLNQFVFFKMMKVIAASEITVRDRLPDGFNFRPIPIDEFRSLSTNPEYEISPILMDEICREGNRCFGVFDRDVLANYVLMYASSAQMTKDLEVSFDPRYGYLCMTFTHPGYRGLHLSSIGVGLAAQSFMESGFESLLAYVESHNFSSLKSLFRIGWREIGSAYIMRCFGRYFVRVTASCSPYGFRVIRVSADRAPLLDVDAA